MDKKIDAPPMVSANALGEILRDLSTCLSLQQEMGVNRVDLSPDTVRCMDHWQRGKFYTPPGPTGAGERIPPPTSHAVPPASRHTQQGARTTTPEPPIASLKTPDSQPHKAVPPMPTNEGLRDVASTVKNTASPDIQGRGTGVSGIFFLCDADSHDEQQQPDITQGPAGDLFLNILKAMGLSADQAYIISFSPPPPHAPSPDGGWQKQVKTYVFQKMKEMNPRIICSMGEQALQVMLGDAVRLDHAEGRFHNMATALFIPTFHPSRLIEDPALKRPVWESMKRIMQRVGL